MQPHRSFRKRLWEGVRKAAQRLAAVLPDLAAGLFLVVGWSALTWAICLVLPSHQRVVILVSVGVLCMAYPGLGWTARIFWRGLYSLSVETEPGEDTE